MAHKKITMARRLRQLTAVIITPMILAIAVLIGVLVWYVFQYDTLLTNVTMASDFNQNFKNDVDLKMFYFVIDSAYSEGMPVEEVRAAKELAETLRKTTTESNSIEAIESVRDLCVTLEIRMQDVADTANYDSRVEQLENNIYILTELIETYMYNYLYYESAHMNLIQAEVAQNITRLIMVLIIAIALVLTVVMWFSNRITGQITEPLSALAGRINEIKKGDFSRHKPIDAHEIEIRTLSEGVEDMVGQLTNLIAETNKAERRKRKAELELLQSQINPHFLYNTLDTIIWLIETDAKETSIDMVTSLSDFFRTSLSKGRDVITLREEQNHVLAYLKIQKTRYQDRMDFDIQIPDELLDCVLPKLTLQPLVENSIYHGIKMQREKGKIRITAVDIGDKIEIKVSDNGAGMTEERLWELKNALRSKDKVGFGLRTVHERLSLFFGEEYGLELQSTLGVGTIVTASIPKQKMEQVEVTGHE